MKKILIAIVLISCIYIGCSKNTSSSKWEERKSTGNYRIVGFVKQKKFAAEYKDSTGTWWFLKSDSLGVLLTKDTTLSDRALCYSLVVKHRQMNNFNPDDAVQYFDEKNIPFETK